MMQNIKRKSLEKLMKNKKLILYISSGDIFLLTEDTEDEILTVFEKLCDCVGFVLNFGNKGKLYCHKFRQDSAADIKEKLSALFNKNNITMPDLKTISIIQSDSDVKSIEKDDKIFLIKKNTHSFMQDDPSDLDSEDCEPISFQETMKIFSKKLKNLKDENLTSEKYEAGIPTLDTLNEQEDKGLFTISRDSKNEGQKLYIKKHNTKNTVSQSNEQIFMNCLLDVFLKQENKYSHDDIYYYLEGVVEKYNVKTGNNIYFDNTNNKVTYCNLNDASKFDTYQTTVEHQPYVKQDTIEKYGEHPLLSNTEFSPEIVCETIDKKRLEEIIEKNKNIKITIQNMLEDPSDLKSLKTSSFPPNQEPLEPKLEPSKHSLQNTINTIKKLYKHID